MSLSVAADVGQTGARVRLVAPGESRDHHVAGHTGGVPLHETVARVLASAAATAGGPLSIDCLALGLTGVHGRVPDARDLRAVLPPDWQVAEIRAVDDSVAAHLAAFAGGAGASIVVGTGVAVLAWGGQGPWAHGEGLGPLLGDRGGGLWVGLAGIRRAARALDGVGPMTDLVDRAQARFGPVERWSDVLVWDPRVVPQVAGFCVDVLASAREGDGVAMDIVREAVEDLARTMVATADRAGIEEGGMSCVMMGNVSRATDLITGPWAARVRQLDPRLRIIEVSREPIDALVDLATRPIPAAVRALVGQA